MKKIALIALIATMLVSCSPSTEITGSWKNPNIESIAPAGSIETIFVTALTERLNARQTVENDLAAALENKGYTTVKSIDALPPTFTNGEKPDKEKMFDEIKKTGAQAILTVALIDEKTETRYNSGDLNYAPIPRFGYYGTFWGYYNAWSPTLYSPGYYSEDNVYFIETNLYDVKSEKLLWSAQSRTYNPKSLDTFSDEFSKVVVSSLEHENLLEGADNEALASEREDDER